MHIHFITVWRNILLEQAIWKKVKAFTYQNRHCRARILQRKNWLVEFFFCK